MPEPTASPGASGARDESIAGVLDQLRAGVRQRQAELACLDRQRGDLPAFLAAVRRDATLEEPSFRTEGTGAVRGFVERAFYVLFARRQHRALLRQQNRFNQSVELALLELHDRNQVLAAELQRTAERLRQTESAPRALYAGAEPLIEPALLAPRSTGRVAGQS
jgi:hypothetical protein